MAKYTSAEAKAFIEYIAPMIQREGFARGYSAKILELRLQYQSFQSFT